MNEKSVEIHLGYWKRGSDLADCVDESKKQYEAFHVHAEMLRGVADHLDKIYEIVKGHNVKIDADTHMIMVHGSAEVMDKLISAKLAEEFQWDDDEDKDEEKGGDA